MYLLNFLSDPELASTIEEVPSLHKSLPQPPRSPTINQNENIEEGEIIEEDVIDLTENTSAVKTPKPKRTRVNPGPATKQVPAQPSEEAPVKDEICRVDSESESEEEMFW